ncbi:MAG: guanylate kinase [Lachnospiraceae bacterium]|nr:guanylate kinase [Lachnospiraceae bacterium]
MGIIYCIMGKSASGKDTVYKRLLELQPVSLRSIVTYTTRPIRTEETEGVEYNFVTPDILKKMRKQGLIIEERCYHTVHGDWYYFTADDGQIKDDETYLLVQTPEGYKSLRDYYGRDRVRPIYIEVEDGLRLARAVERERLEANPRYTELCRRFIADEADFSESVLLSLGIDKRYQNADFDKCIAELSQDLKEFLKESRKDSAKPHEPGKIIYPPKSK